MRFRLEHSVDEIRIMRALFAPREVNEQVFRWIYWRTLSAKKAIPASRGEQRSTGSVSSTMFKMRETFSCHCEPGSHDRENGQNQSMQFINDDRCCLGGHPCRLDLYHLQLNRESSTIEIELTQRRVADISTAPVATIMLSLLGPFEVARAHRDNRLFFQRFLKRAFFATISTSKIRAKG